MQVQLYVYHTCVKIKYVYIFYILCRVYVCVHIYIYIYICYPASGVHGPGGYPPYPPPPTTSTGGYIDIYIYRHIRPHVCVYIYTTCMYKYTYIYIQINNHILYYSIQKYMHIHTHLYNLVKIPYTYRDRHHLERGGGECYGRLALIWRILYIQDLPGAAFA